MQTVKNKIVTLKGKLQEAENAADEAEAELEKILEEETQLTEEAEAKTAELNEIEDKLDAAESKLQGYMEQFGLAEKGSEEGLQARKQLENRARNDNKRVTELERELGEVNAALAEVIERYEEVAK